MTDLCGTECWVHGGFAGDFLALRDNVLVQMLKSYQSLPASPANRRLVVTGHSLGKQCL